MSGYTGLKRLFCACAVITIAACGTDTATAPNNSATEDQLFMNAARTAWAFVENNTQPNTGLAQAHYAFQYVTTWDIASQIAATYAAHELGIIDDASYDGRIRKILGTLASISLFEGAAFNRFYDSQTGKMVSRDYQISTTGFGWSDTDQGRLLTWLHILAVKQPQYAPLASAIVNRLNYSRLIANGTLQGFDVAANGTRNAYSETGLGYEQYAAGGFALWGHRAPNSLNPTAYATTVDVLGVPVYVDKRGLARATSEPYMVIGMETGWWAPALKDQAWQILSAQQARFDQTGVITMATEDALPDPPYYFYYYSIYHSGKSFVVEGPGMGTVVEKPRWVSAKAAFAWRALFPTDYTLKAFDAVQPAAIDGKGWGAGVYENSLQPTGEASLNTAGVILEAALYHRLASSFVADPIS
jgi:Protein of unknown function (DUF3131)